jgi:hypothetical protein
MESDDGTTPQREGPVLFQLAPRVSDGDPRQNKGGNGNHTTLMKCTGIPSQQCERVSNANRVECAGSQKHH